MDSLQIVLAVVVILAMVAVSIWSTAKDKKPRALADDGGPSKDAIASLNAPEKPLTKADAKRVLAKYTPRQLAAARRNDPTSVSDLMEFMTPDERDVFFADRMDKMALEARGRWFYTKLSGVSHANSDGTSRQQIIQGLEYAEVLRVEHEPENEFDPNAMMVLRASGEQIGFLNPDVARQCILAREAGEGVAAFVAHFNHADGAEFWGVTVGLLFMDMTETEAE